MNTIGEAFFALLTPELQEEYLAFGHCSLSRYDVTRLWHVGPYKKHLHERFNEDEAACHIAATICEEGSPITRIKAGAKFTAGEAAIALLIAAIKGGDNAPSDGNVDFDIIAIDVEGSLASRSGLIEEFGIARIQALNLSNPALGSSPVLIESRNYLRKSSRRAAFAFGDSIKTNTHQLPEVVLNELVNGTASQKTDATARSFIIVGHSILSDVYFLYHALGINITELPNLIGMLDTQAIAGKTFGGNRTSLRELLNQLHIPFRQYGPRNVKNVLHCAGNDAHLTLRAFLAMLHHRVHKTGGGESTKWLERAARAPLPTY
jgi:hypothetical protein